MSLNVGLVGCGAIAPVHAAAIQAASEANLVAVTDIDQAKAQDFANTWKCEAVADYEALLERSDIDVIHICTPHYLHTPMAEAALKRKKHVLVEKPVALDVAEGERVADYAASQGLQYGVVFQNRYNEASVETKAYLNEQRLGKLLGMRAVVTWHRDSSYYASGSWRGKWDTEGGGVLINQTIHTLDLLQWYGGELAQVRGQASNLALSDVIEVEDTATAVLDFTSGARAVYFATNAHVTDSAVDIEVICERGTLVQRRDSLYLVQGGEEKLLCDPPEQPNVGKSYWGIGHRRCMEDFYNCVLTHRPFPISAREGLKALQIVKTIQASFR